MSPVDYALLGLTAYFVIKGLIRGMLKEVFGILALVVGAIVAYLYAEELAAVLSAHISQSQYALIVSYISLFILSALIINYLGKVLTTVAKTLALSLVNRLLGGVIGLLKGLIIVFALWYLIFLLQVYQDIELPQLIGESIVLEVLSPWLENLFLAD